MHFWLNLKLYETKRTEASISRLLWFWLLYISFPCFLVAQSREYSAETSPSGSHRGLGAIQREGEKRRRRAFSSGWFDCDVLPVWLSACGVSFIFPQFCPLTPTTTAALPEHNTPTKPCVPPVCSSMTPSPCGLTAAFSSLFSLSLSLVLFLFFPWERIILAHRLAEWGMYCALL